MNIETNSDSNETKLIGEGSYGCVYEPTFKCKDGTKVDEKSELGKIMERKHAINEYNESKIMEKIDPTHEISIEKPKICKPVLNETTLQALKSCSFASKMDNFKKNQLEMLVLKDGGIDLSIWLDKIEELKMSENVSQKNIKSQISKMWKCFGNLVRNGLAILLKNKTLHHDLKAQNIVYDLENNIMKFIDYGFLITIPEVIESSAKSNYKYAGFHWSYPFETGFYNKNMFDRFCNFSMQEKQNYFQKLKHNVIYNIKNNINDDTENDDIDALITVLAKFRGLGDERFNNYLEFYLQELEKFYLQLNYTDTNSYLRFMNQSLNTFDLYGLGMTAMYLYSHLGETNERKFEKIKEMMHPNPFMRKIYWDFV